MIVAIIHLTRVVNLLTGHSVALVIFLTFASESTIRVRTSCFLMTVVLSFLALIDVYTSLLLVFLVTSRTFAVEAFLCGDTLFIGLTSISAFFTLISLFARLTISFP